MCECILHEQHQIQSRWLLPPLLHSNKAIPPACSICGQLRCDKPPFLPSTRIQNVHADQAFNYSSSKVCFRLGSAPNPHSLSNEEVLEATADVQLLNIPDQTCFIKSSAFLTPFSLWDQARRKISSDNVHISHFSIKAEFNRHTVPDVESLSQCNAGQPLLIQWWFTIWKCPFALRPVTQILPTAAHTSPPCPRPLFSTACCFKAAVSQNRKFPWLSPAAAAVLCMQVEICKQQKVCARQLNTAALCIVFLSVFLFCQPGGGEA